MTNMEDIAPGAQEVFRQISTSDHVKYFFNYHDGAWTVSSRRSFDIKNQNACKFTVGIDSDFAAKFNKLAPFITIDDEKLEKLDLENPDVPFVFQSKVRSELHEVDDGPESLVWEEMEELLSKEPATIVHFPADQYITFYVETGVFETKFGNAESNFVIAWKDASGPKLYSRFNDGTIKQLGASDNFWTGQGLKDRNEEGVWTGINRTTAPTNSYGDDLPTNPFFVEDF